MPYCTLQELVTRFGHDELLQLTDRQGTGAIDANPVNAALADADALIDGYLAQRYALPVTPVPALLRRLAGDIARCLLHSDRPTDQVRRAHDDAVAMLRDLAAGKAALAGAAAAPPAQSPAAAGGTPRAAAAPRIFDRASIGDFLG